MIPNPGSDEAIDAGCICPVMDNEYGRGYMGIKGVFVHRIDCPVHEDIIEDILLDEQDD